MHEVMLAEGLLAAIEGEAAKQNARPVGAKISCGILSAVNNEALCFAFEAVTQGTEYEGMKLEIEHKPAQGRCEKCNEVFSIDFSCPVCPKCGGGNFKLLPDAPLVLEQIEFQTE